MIRIAIAVVMLVGLGWQAAAGTADAPPPRLRELVTVTSDLVRIGDLVENAGAAAGIAVFRAPDLGQTGSVPVSRVAEALSAYDVTGIDTGSLSEVIVTRLSRALTVQDITERIARAIAGQYGYGDAQDLGIILDRDVRTLHIEAAGVGELSVIGLRVEPRTGRFDIAFEIPGSVVARRLPLRFTGTVTQTVEAATLVRAVRAGAVIKASDVMVERRPRGDVGNEAMAADQVVGLATKSSLRAGVALRAGDLIRPQVVQRNEAVTMFFEVPGIKLTVRGKATEAGAVGDMIAVLNTQSNRTIQATVTGPGRVTVGSPTAVVASAATESNDESEPPRTQ
jgi:flagella basal body P-ring formation protein FlgA